MTTKILMYVLFENLLYYKSPKLPLKAVQMKNYEQSSHTKMDILNISRLLECGFNNSYCY